MYNNTNHQNVQQEHTTHNNLYTLDNYKLQLCSDLEDPNRTNDWNSTNSHKIELVIAYNNNAGKIHYIQNYSMHCISN